MTASADAVGHALRCQLRRAQGDIDQREITSSGRHLVYNGAVFVGAKNSLNANRLSSFQPRDNLAKNGVGCLNESVKQN